MPSKLGGDVQNEPVNACLSVSLSAFNHIFFPTLLLFTLVRIIIVLMFICICNAITERQVQSAVAQGANSMSDLQAQLGVATCCGCCAETANEYLPGGRYAGQASVEHQHGTPVPPAANDPVAQPVVFTEEIVARRA